MLPIILDESRGSGIRGIASYILQDEFTDTLAAGSVDDTNAAPGPGLRDVVTDTNLKLSVGSGVLSLATGGVAAGDPGIYYSQLTRRTGQVAMLSTIPPTTGNNHMVGLDFNQTGAISESFVFASGPQLRLYSGGFIRSIGIYSANGKPYYCALVQRPTGEYFFIKNDDWYPNWVMIYHDMQNATDLYPAAAVLSSGGYGTVDFLRIPVQTWLPTPIAYDSFTRSDGAIGSSEIVGPEGQPAPSKTWSGSTFTISSNVAINTPATLGADDITNGDMETGSPPSNWSGDGATLASEADERTGGSGSASISVTNDGAARGYAVQSLDLPDGTWVRADLWRKKITGDPHWRITESDDTLLTSGGGAATSWVHSYLTCRLVGASCKLKLGSSVNVGEEARFDDVSVKALTFSELITTFDAGVPAVIASVGITNTSFGSVGVILNVDNASNPQNFLLCWLEGSDIYLDKCVGGTWTRLIGTGISYSAGAELKVATHMQSGTLRVSIFYDNTLEGAQQTISDAGIISNTIHGMFATDGDQPNQLDNFTLYAAGEEGQYNAFLDRVIAG